MSLDAAADELNHYTGNVWTHIISLKREDAARLGYDNGTAWRTLLRTHRNDIAAAMNIKPEDFRWYAAFHNEGNHPHVHMMAWSATPGQAYLDRDGIKEIKSTLTNQIFQQELLHLYEEKSASRDELVRQTRQAMLELAQRMRDGLCICPAAEKKLWALSQKLDGVSGKKVYGYLPKPLKQLADEVVDGNRCSVTTSMSRYAGKKTGKKIADEETAQKIIAAPENESIKYETYFKLIIATGMRRGECCALQWRDIDREQLNIHSLRHTAASLMIAGGADMATVAGILGHSQLSATLDIYYPRLR